jgi:hypothetical protein
MVWGKLRVEGSGKSRPGYCMSNMNPDSTCYLHDEMLRVKYAAYPKKERKVVYITMIENLNTKLKKNI